MADCGDDCKNPCVSVPTLTGGEVEGAGTFDELMRTVKDHLEQEFTKNRITGSNYSTVYLGVMQSVLQIASEFTLQAAIAQQQRLLLEEQTTQTERQTDLIIQQICNTKADTAIKEKQLDIMDQQLLDMQANTALVVAKTDESICTLEVMATQIVLNTCQANLIGAQTGLTCQQTCVAKEEEVLKRCQQDLTCSQTNLTVQKCTTEEAQVCNPSELIVCDICLQDGCCTPTGYKCYEGGGVLGAQIALVNKQKDGFDRDAQQKAAKILADNWTIRQSTAQGQDPFGAGMSDKEINRVLDEVKRGIFLTKNTDTDNPED